MIQVINLPMPPSVNCLYRNVRGRGRVKTKRYLAWINEAGWMLNLQKPKRFVGKVSLDIKAGKPDNRRRDVMNLEKALSDLMTSMGLIEDDSLVQSFSIKWADDIKGVVVTIEGEGA